MHKKSIGFNWGPCAVSTGYWTGVRMSTLLKMAGVRTGEGSAANYVSFKGPKGELPKGDDGSYGESDPCTQCWQCACWLPVAGRCRLLVCL